MAEVIKSFPDSKMSNPHSRALFDAVKVGSYQPIHSLISQGISPNVRDEEGRTPLMIASERAYNNIACLLIDAGADVNAQGPLGTTPLIYAAAYGRYETVKLLLERGADVGATTTGMYPSNAVFAASANCHEDVVKLLKGTKE
jgi:ankyrin repeat protein